VLFFAHAGQVWAHLLLLYNYRGLNAITRPAVKSLPHIDSLLVGTLGLRVVTKLDQACNYHQLLMFASYCQWWKTSFL
jgi:hypothetical protein